MVKLIIPVSKPEEGAAGLTGIWRSFKPIIDQEKCKHCLMCWLYCPEGAIERIGEDKLTVKINYDYCKGCGICADICPFKAITMVREE
ncbi:MAG: 4Fe-4S binding protein [archaeon GB-1867-097]|nr:4Fe-4S binding protein [Candidatus Verstraetearchaeota archaeon]MCS7374274.1 4Fe-4S binding protein [Candidatus Culexmicrobium thermophilum]MCS7384239.1 4Fe-4S binding protein [Candidatus Culexmicrobium thermophilum]RLE56393.1 MAG: ferredoxin [Candidatus Verstraetearchaeota archaeon]HDO20941.1 4Fe-4S dicluster domain-containing protein [Candidatus Bathyarchaeota archaeon]